MTPGELGFQLPPDLIEIVRQQRHDVHAADQGELVAERLLDSQQVHAGLDFVGWRQLTPGLDQLRNQRLDEPVAMQDDGQGLCRGRSPSRACARGRIISRYMAGDMKGRRLKPRSSQTQRRRASLLRVEHFEDVDGDRPRRRRTYP